MQIRQMIVGDVDGVMGIEAACLSPWSRAQVSEELDKQAGLALVAVTSSGVVRGWCCGLLAALDAELLKIAVCPTLRGQGVATDLFNKLCCVFAARGGEQIFLEVRSQNLSARKFYVKQNFQEAGRRKNYYKEPVDDAIIFVRKLNEDKE